MSSKPTVSIIIPTYNRASRAVDCARHLLKETWRPLEIVVVNDASPDNTKEVLDDLKANWDEPECTLEVVHHETNQGVSVARNTGASRATGDYVGFLDDDDRFKGDKIRKQVECMQAEGTDACCSYVSEHTPDGPKRFPGPGRHLIRGKDFSEVMRRNHVVHFSSILVTREFLERTGEFDPNLTHGEDQDWIVRLALTACFSAVEVELVDYMYTPGSLSDFADVFALAVNDACRHHHTRKMKSLFGDQPGWDESAWLDWVRRAYPTMIRHMLYAGRVKDGFEMWKFAMKATGGEMLFRKIRKKLWKARWLDLFGKRLKHPKSVDGTSLS